MKARFANCGSRNQAHAGLGMVPPAARYLSCWWTNTVPLGFVLLLIGLAGTFSAPGVEVCLESGFADPPLNSRLRAYWWWLNGNVTAAAITRDLEEMRAKGFGGALLCDAGGAEQDGNAQVPHGPTFFSAEWRELYRHTLREADRLGLEISLNIMSGWNLGGPMVKAEDAAKKLVWSEAQVTGPASVDQPLPVPRSRDNFYQDLFVVAFQLKPNASRPKPLRNWEQKGVHKALNFSAPDTTPLFQEWPSEAGESEVRAGEVLDLSSRLGADGRLRWKAPTGTWQVIRFGCTIGDHSRVSTCSQGWEGYALDVLDAGAFVRYWDAVVEPLIADAGPLAGRTLKYLHTDSWEVEAINWTPTLRQEFHRRRGYDFLPYLPALTGRIVDSRPVSNRFLHDFRKTLGDLAIDHHYRLFRDRAHRRGLLIHPESGGPHAVPVDAQRCLGWNDAPMSEFWAWSWRHRVGDENRFFVKQPASAAHTYGRRLVLAEGFTTIGPHWQETLWDNLKPSFDKALCEGLNLLVWHAFVCSPEAMGMPGQQYFAGTHLNPNVTWWSKSDSFFAYLNRCQFLLQQGLFVADACYYYGDHVPNFSQLKRSDPARVLPGYDYDVISEEALLTRMSFRQGRLVLPDGMSYRVLVLPDRVVISLPVLRKLRELVAAGATIIGPRPAHASGLEDYPKSDRQVAKLAEQLWGKELLGASKGRHDFGKGRVFWGATAREVLQADGVRADFDFEPLPASQDRPLDYVHRRIQNAELYFVANRSSQWAQMPCRFRVTGKTPELWNPVTGQRRFVNSCETSEGQSVLPLEFPPYGSWFVLFRQSADRSAVRNGGNYSEFKEAQALHGPWTVRFDPRWGGPATATFDELVSWTSRAEPGIKFYSGTATYSLVFNASDAVVDPTRSVWLDLGRIRELAQVRLNGQDLGVVWAPPFRVKVTGALKPTGNLLEVEVVNFWPNRIIGDQSLAPEQRLTRTNIRKLTGDTPLMDSGLLGPVTLQLEVAQ
jgi:hypothetical protein